MKLQKPRIPAKPRIPRMPRMPKMPVDGTFTRGPKPKVRKVILDGSFVHALLATDSPDHRIAREVYSALVDNSAIELDRLFALSTVLGEVPKEFRRGALAPVTTLYVSRQHRSAARAVVEAPSFETALTLVMMRRERIRVVAATSHDFDPFDVQVLGAQPPDVETVSDEPTPAGYEAYRGPSLTAVVKGFNPGTEPPPAPRSTDE